MQTIALENNPLTLAELVRSLAGQGEIIITQNSQPVAKVIPAQPERGFGCARGLIALAADFDEPLECLRDYRP
jgi:antitoxin (DNA-binding transcriptional repressor) of toxin-antitoxin stability system